MSLAPAAPVAATQSLTVMVAGSLVGSCLPLLATSGRRLLVCRLRHLVGGNAVS